MKYIDMQKFPLQMKDNDSLMTHLYQDPTGCDAITAISVYQMPKTSVCGNWIEIEFGKLLSDCPTSTGRSEVKLSVKFLVPLCSEYNQ